MGNHIVWDMIKPWPVCVHYRTDTIVRVFLDRIGGGLSCLPGCFSIWSSFNDHNVQKYAKCDHDDPDHNITFMIKSWPVCVRYGTDTIVRVFLDRIGGGLSCLPGCYSIWSSFNDHNVQKYAKCDHDDPDHNITCMIKSWPLCVHCRTDTIVRVFLDRIGGG